MTERAPAWADVVARLQFPRFSSARGVLRYRDPDDEPVEQRLRFWHAAPRSWRVDDEQGLLYLSTPDLILERDGEGRLQRLPPGPVLLPSAVEGLFGDDLNRDLFRDPNDYCAATGPGVPVEIAGRPAWEFVLAPPPRKPYPLRVAVDDATGVLLRFAVPELDAEVEVVEIEVDQGVHPDVFRWDGPVAEDRLAELAQHEASERWFEEHQVPVPRYWPAGVGHMPLRADPATGAFVADLLVPDEPVLLARWPIGGDPPPGWAAMIERQHVHWWAEGKWAWALSVSSPLSPEELARVRASFPAPEV